MKQNIDIDSLLRKSVKSEGLKAPGKNFSEKVMAAIQREEFQKEAYKPLLPASAFAAIIFFVLILVGYMFFSPSAQGEFFFNSNSINKILNRVLNFKFEIPAGVSYIVACISLMLLFQVFIISRFARKMY